MLPEGHSEALADFADQDMLRVLAELYGENAQAMLLMAKPPKPPIGRPQELPPIRKGEPEKKHIKRDGKK